MNRRPNLLPGLVLIALAIGLGGGGAFWMSQTAPSFQAAATVRIIRDQTDLNEDPTNVPPAISESVFLQNEAEIANSDAVLSNVLEKLDLRREWGKKFGQGQPLPLAESLTRLRDRMIVTRQPGTSQFQVAAKDGSAAAAQALANALAAACCENRLERRRHRAQEGIDLLSGPYHETEAEYQQASAKLEQARLALDPAIRDLSSPPAASAESPELHDLRVQFSRLTMTFMAQSNQLARSQAFPAEELQKIEEQFNRTTNALVTVQAAMQSELRAQQALRAYWDARQELDRVNLLFVPIKRAIAERQRELEPPPNPLAVVAEPADSAVKLPTRNVGAFACFGAAALLLLTGIRMFAAGGKSAAPA